MKAVRYAESLNASLRRLLAADERVFVFGEDIADPYGGAFKVTLGLSSEFPGRVVNTPISEAGLTGLAVGLALKGRLPILEIMFGDFVTLCADPLINGAGKFRDMYGGGTPVPLVVRTPMGGRRGYGPTHSQTLETIFFNAPGLTIVAPSLFFDPGTLLERAVLEDESPVLFIENKSLYPERVKIEASGRIDDFYVRTLPVDSRLYPTLALTPLSGENPDVILTAYGGMAHLAAEAAWNVFMKEEIITELIVPSLIKPFSVEGLTNAVRSCGRLVVAEEAPRTAGWGAELSARIQENCFPALKTGVRRVAAPDRPVPCAKQMEQAMLPSIKDIETVLYEIVK
jgi:pyruvate/2-oxoglutarate/acetoin dehydrogenase E1 component